MAGLKANNNNNGELENISQESQMQLDFRFFGLQGTNKLSLNHIKNKNERSRSAAVQNQSEQKTRPIKESPSERYFHSIGVFSRFLFFILYFSCIFAVVVCGNNQKTGWNSSKQLWQSQKETTATNPHILTTTKPPQIEIQIQIRIRIGIGIPNGETEVQATEERRILWFLLNLITCCYIITVLILVSHFLCLLPISFQMHVSHGLYGQGLRYQVQALLTIALPEWWNLSVQWPDLRLQVSERWVTY